MRKMKRLIALMGAALLVALTPASAMAATGGYVPTAGTYYYLENGQWVQGSTFKKSYKKDGRITKSQSISTEGKVSTTTYSWKGNFLKKRTTIGNSGNTSTGVYKYKKNLRKSYTYTSGSGTTTYSYKWKKKKGTFTVTSSDGSSTTTGTLKVNGKNQIVSQSYKYSDGTTSTTTRKFYSNGNLKESKTVNSEGGVTIQKFNKNGYETSYSYSSSGYSFTETYKYKMDKKKKCPKELTYSWSTSDGDSGSTRTVYTSFKKVSRIRNCDASGVMVSLG